MILDKYGLWVDRKDKNQHLKLNDGANYLQHDPTLDPDILRCPKCRSNRTHRRGLRTKVLADGSTKAYGQKIYCNNCRKISTL